MLAGAPSAVRLFDMYFPPLAIAIVAGLPCAIVVAKLLNATGLSRHFRNPPLAFTALWVLATALIGLFILEP